MRLLLLPILILGIISCVPKNNSSEAEVDESISESSSDFNPHDSSQNNGGGGGEISLSQSVLAQTDMGMLTFKALNFQYSKLTGINRSRVNDTYIQVRNSLPSKRHPDFYNKFAIIASSRLANVYCNIFIDENIQWQNIVDQYISLFLDEKVPNSYDYVRDQLMKIMNNDIASPIDGGRFIATVDGNGNALSSLVKNKRLAKMACTALLASSPVTSISGQREY
jgi:hypothetical protein